jgi:hypothetical protein
MRNKQLWRRFVLFAVFFSVLFALPTHVFADFLAPVNTNPIPLFITLSINLVINFSAIFLICKYYLAFQNIKRVFLASFIITILGAIIDIVSLVIANIVIQVATISYPDLNLILNLLIFLTSFIFLWIMYYFMIRLVFRIVTVKKSIISAIILALVTNPIWLIIVSTFIPFPGWFTMFL